MNVGSLFSGIGGMDHGLHRAGLTHRFFCESDEWRRSVLAHHWPGVPIFEEVREVDPSTWASRIEPQRRAVGGNGPSSVVDAERDNAERIDLLCGGFPCQDLSVAGRRRGLAGERSGLFYEFARITDAVRPRWLLVENVPGLFSSNGGRDFGIVLRTLADIGYGVAWRVLDSRFFGVPQRRRRVYILGALADGDPRAAAERAGQVLAVGTRCKRHPAARTQTGSDVAVASALGTGNGGAGGWRIGAEEAAGNQIVSYALNGKHGKRDDGVPSIPQTFNWQMGGSWTEGGMSRSWMHDTPGRARSLVKNKTLAVWEPQATGVRRLTPVECERLQALPDGWTDHGPDSRRYAALGDAVTSSVAEWIGRRLMAA